MTDTTNDLYWHSLNYRTAGTLEAEAMWQELRSCVDRLIAFEREKLRHEVLADVVRAVMRA